jgi:hypothetical protein
LKQSAKTEYKLSAIIYFMIAFVLVGFAIVSLVQGVKTQFAGDTLFGFALYIATPLLVFVSYLSYQKAHYKLHVLAMARD